VVAPPSAYRDEPNQRAVDSAPAVRSGPVELSPKAGPASRGAQRQSNIEGHPAEAAKARQLASIGESPADADLDVTQLAAWTGVAKLILNLDETMTKE